MSEDTNKNHRPAEATDAKKSGEHGEHHVDPAVLKKHIDDIAKVEVAKLQKALGEGGRVTEAQAREIHKQAGYIAKAEHDAEHYLPRSTDSLLHQVAYDQAIEQKALAVSVMHEIIHPTHYARWDPRRYLYQIPLPDWRRLVKTMNENKAATAAVSSLGFYGAYEAATSPFVTDILAKIASSGVATPAWLTSIGNGGILFGSALGAGLLGRWLGGLAGRRLEKKGIISEKNAKTTGAILGAGGTTLALSFATAASGAPLLTGGPLTLGIGVAAWAAIRAYKRWYRRNRPVEHHGSLETDAITKERERIEEAGIYFFSDPAKAKYTEARTEALAALKKAHDESPTDVPKKEAYEAGVKTEERRKSETIDALRERLAKLGLDKENTSIKEADTSENALMDAIIAMKAVEKSKDAKETAEKIVRSYRAFKSQVADAESFADKKKKKDPEARKKTKDKADALGDILVGLKRDIITPLEADVPQKKRIDAAAKQAEAAIELAKKAEEPINPLDPVAEHKFIKAEEAERLMSEAVQLMEKVDGIVKEISAMEEKERGENKKVGREIELKEAEKDLKLEIVGARQRNRMEVEDTRAETRREVAQLTSASRLQSARAKATGKVTAIDEKQRQRERTHNITENNEKKNLALAAIEALTMRSSSSRFAAADAFRAALEPITAGTVPTDATLLAIDKASAALATRDETKSLAALGRDITKVARRRYFARKLRGVNIDTRVVEALNAVNALLAGRDDKIKRLLIDYMRLAPDADRIAIQTVVAKVTIDPADITPVSAILQRGLTVPLHDLAA